MREAVRVALIEIAARFSDDAPSVEEQERILRSRYPAFSAWPADAEFSLVVLAWALGPGFRVRGFKEQVNRLLPDFHAAARTIGMGGSPPLITLGGIARRGLENAAVVTRWNLPADILFWPTNLSICPVRKPWTSFARSRTT